MKPNTKKTFLFLYIITMKYLAEIAKYVDLEPAVLDFFVKYITNPI